MFYQVISEERGLDLNKVQFDMLGTAKKVCLFSFILHQFEKFACIHSIQLFTFEQVTVSLDDTLVLHGGGDKKLIEERCEQVMTHFPLLSF